VSLLLCVRGAGIGVQRCRDVLAIFVIQLMVVGVESFKQVLEGTRVSIY
jgi:hypothetical protein